MNVTDLVDFSNEKLQPLLEWKRQLDEELAELRTKREELCEVIARKESQARNLRELLESEGYQAEESRNGVEPPKHSVVDAAYELVSAGGQPLYYKDLADRLIDAGVSIPGRDPQANLLSYIVRDQRFQRIARGTYALAEWGLRPKRSGKSARGRKKRRSEASRGG